ncbi:MAG: ATP-grasp domain-containing protein [Candidatus Auribacter fodinae]|jgi:biotin carboxylase|uniref:ATP-grasp domain-containing protein n=1 Tax=Candidatus Auribacter fodinae TaxID=2093366 RepID=A0A3A4R9U1_9BACT|nr:MAG: ATP-grasp domain-containing protein [Candidatus Auribacter fodinae]
MSLYDNKLLMVIGAGLFQSAAIKQAKELGMKVLASDMDENAVGFQYADYKMIVSTRDIDATVRAARVFSDKIHTVHGVMTVGTDVSRTVAAVAQELGLVGVSPETALCATNKARMRECFWKHGVPAPKWAEVGSLNDALKAVKHIGFPLVVKPVDNMGARGVRRLDSITEVEEALQTALSFSLTGKAVMEEYMAGPELSVDTLVYDGEVHLLTIADRHIEREPFFVEIGHTVPSTISEEMRAQVLDVMKQGIKAVGIRYGASKADMKITKDGPKIGEITARLSGGYHSQYTDPLATGMRSIKAAIDIAIGLPLNIADITPSRNHVACERAIIPEPGRVVAIEGLDQLDSIPGFRHIFLHVKQGDIIQPVVSNMGKAANIICSASNREEAFCSVERVMNTLKIITEPIPAECNLC